LAINLPHHYFLELKDGLVKGIAIIVSLLKGGIQKAADEKHCESIFRI